MNWKKSPGQNQANNEPPLKTLRMNNHKSELKGQDGWECAIARPSLDSVLSHLDTGTKAGVMILMEIPRPIPIVFTFP